MIQQTLDCYQGFRQVASVSISVCAHEMTPPRGNLWVDPKVHSERTRGLGCGFSFRPGKVGNRRGRRVWHRELKPLRRTVYLPEVLSWRRPVVTKSRMMDGC